MEKSADDLGSVTSGRGDPLRRVEESRKHAAQEIVNCARGNVHGRVDRFRLATENF